MLNEGQRPRSVRCIGGAGDEAEAQSLNRGRIAGPSGDGLRLWQAAMRKRAVSMIHRCQY